MAKGTVTISGSTEAQILDGNTTITGWLRVLKGSAFQTHVISSWVME